ncbi:MAG: peptide-methionine (S)-S-oxide reductase MsrA [Chitinophagaceae bacterium]
MLIASGCGDDNMQGRFGQCSQALVSLSDKKIIRTAELHAAIPPLNKPLKMLLYIENKKAVMNIQKAILAGGCFWGVEELFRDLPGVQSTVVGYTGGDVKNATYRNHGTHAEGILLEYDADVISYRQILEFFFQIHNPTTLNRQGNDVGTSYRSAIFYLNEEQKATALELIATMEASKKWPGKIVTQVVPAGDFWNAEEEHQDYLQKHPYGYTCHYIRPEWTTASVV